MAEASAERIARKSTTPCQLNDATRTHLQKFSRSVGVHQRLDFAFDGDLMDAFIGKRVGSRRLGLGIHTWLPAAGWCDRADVSDFFVRFHVGGVDWNCGGSVKNDRREPRQRSCPLTGSSQFRFRPLGNERKCRLLGMWFVRLMVPRGSLSGFRVRKLTLRLSASSRVKLSLIPV